MFHPLLYVKLLSGSVCSLRLKLHMCVSVFSDCFSMNLFVSNTDGNSVAHAKSPCTLLWNVNSKVWRLWQSLLNCVFMFRVKQPDALILLIEPLRLFPGDCPTEKIKSVSVFIVVCIRKNFFVLSKVWTLCYNNAKYEHNFTVSLLHFLFFKVLCTVVMWPGWDQTLCKPWTNAYREWMSFLI